MFGDGPERVEVLRFRPVDRVVRTQPSKGFVRVATLAIKFWRNDMFVTELVALIATR